jgi:hypothetical protein
LRTVAARTRRVDHAPSHGLAYAQACPIGKRAVVGEYVGLDLLGISHGKHRAIAEKIDPWSPTWPPLSA